MTEKIKLTPEEKKIRNLKNKMSKRPRIEVVKQSKYEGNRQTRKETARKEKLAKRNEPVVGPTPKDLKLGNRATRRALLKNNK